MIRLGELGRTAVRVTAGVMVGGALVAARVGEWTTGLVMGLVALGCVGALLRGRAGRVDGASDPGRPDDGG